MTSGLRIGTPAVTSRGFKEADVRKVADLIVQMLNEPDEETKQAVRNGVQELTVKYPIN